MGCEEIREDLVAWLDGELDPDAVARVDRHVAACAACARELAALRDLGRQVAQAFAGAGAAVDRDRPSLERVLSALGAEAPTVMRSSDVRPGGRFGPADATRSAGSARFARARRGRRGHGLQSGDRPQRAGRRLGLVLGGTLAAGLALALGIGLGDFGRPPWVAPQAPEPAAPVSLAARDGVGTAARPGEPPAAEPRRQVAQAPARRSENTPSNGRVLASADPAPVSEDDLDVPDEVLQRPGLFLDIGIVHRLDKLQNLEAVYRQSDEHSG
jgi:hypothetical protein